MVGDSTSSVIITWERGEVTISSRQPYTVLLPLQTFDQSSALFVRSKIRAYSLCRGGSNHALVAFMPIQLREILARTQPTDSCIMTGKRFVSSTELLTFPSWVHTHCLKHGFGVKANKVNQIVLGRPASANFRSPCKCV